MKQKHFVLASRVSAIVLMVSLFAWTFPAFPYPVQASDDANNCSTTSGVYSGNLIIHTGSDITLSGSVLEYWCDTIRIDSGKTLTVDTSAGFSVTAQETLPLGLAFKTDGTKMYVVGETNDTVYQYSLSTAWDLSTASYDSVSFSVAAQDTIPHDVVFKADGTKMYVVGVGADAVYQYSLSTAWDLSTASYDSVSFSVAAQENNPTDLFFKTDGTKMYVVGTTGDMVLQYSLSGAWDLSTASYSSVSFSVSAQEATPFGLAFKTDGTKMYVVGVAGDIVSQYSLSTAWDLSTASYDSVGVSVSAQEANAHDVVFKTDGTKMYVMGTTGDTVYPYSLSVAWSLSAVSYDRGQITLNANNIIVNGTITAAGKGFSGGTGGAGGAGGTAGVGGAAAAANNGTSGGNGGNGLAGTAGSGSFGGAGGALATGNAGGAGGAFGASGGAGGERGIESGSSNAGADGGYSAAGTNGDTSTDESLNSGSGGGGASGAPGGGGGGGGGADSTVTTGGAGGNGGVGGSGTAGGAGGAGGGIIKLHARQSLSGSGTINAKGNAGTLGSSGFAGANGIVGGGTIGGAAGTGGVPGGSASTAGGNGSSDGGGGGGGGGYGSAGNSGGDGAGGGVLLKADAVSGMTFNGTVDVRGGNNKTSIGGTVKIFYSCSKYGSTINAGRTFESVMNGCPVATIPLPPPETSTSGGSAATPTNTETETITNETGGTVTETAANDGSTATVAVEPGTTTDDASFTVMTFSASEVYTNDPLPSELRPGGQAVFDISASVGGAAVTTFNVRPLSLRFTYRENQWAQGVLENNIRLAMFDQTEGLWHVLEDAVIDTVTNTVMYTADHLTRFALVAPADIVPPAPPTNVTAVRQVNSVMLSWISPTRDFHHTRILRSSDAAVEGTVIAKSVRGASYEDTTASAAMTYYYTVLSVDLAGNQSSNVTVAAADAKVPESPGTSEVFASPAASAIADGALVRMEGDSKVWIVRKAGDVIVLRHVVDARLFYVYGHLGGASAWGRIRRVASLDNTRPSAWVRSPDGKVWEVNGDGTRHWMHMTWEQFVSRVAGGSSSLVPKLIFEVNDPEMRLYTPGPDVLP